MLTRIAVWLRKTAESMATPCSVKANGNDEECFSFSNRSQFVTLNEKGNALRSQIAILNGRGGSRYLPYAFTRIGLMDSTVPVEAVV